MLTLACSPSLPSSLHQSPLDSKYYTPPPQVPPFSSSSDAEYHRFVTFSSALAKASLLRMYRASFRLRSCKLQRSNQWKSPQIIMLGSSAEFRARTNRGRRRRVWRCLSSSMLPSMLNDQTPLNPVMQDIFIPPNFNIRDRKPEIRRVWWR